MLGSIFDFSAYTTELTRNFTGREWVFAEIDRWLADNDTPRYFIVASEPGIGKAAIGARLTQIRGDIAACYFCIAGRNSTVRPATALRSPAAQLGDGLP